MRYPTNILLRSNTSENGTNISRTRRLSAKWQYILFLKETNMKKTHQVRTNMMRMNLQDIYQERELVLVVIKIKLILLGIKLGLIYVSLIRIS